MVSPIAIIDLIAFSGTLCALGICIFFTYKKVASEGVNAFIILLTALAAYECLITIEWLGITSRLDFFEDYIGALLPLCWLFAFYVMANTVINSELSESERRFTYAMEATNDGLWDWDVSTGKVFYSPHWFSMLGYTDKELPSNYNTWRLLLHPDDLEYSTNVIQTNIELDQPFELEFRLKTKDGGWLWVLSRGKVVEWASEGKPLRVVGTHVDISQRKQREVQIKELQQYLSSIINSMPSVLIGVDSALNVTLWNSTAVEQTGIPVKGALGNPLKEVFPRLENDSELINLAMQTGLSQQDNLRTYYKDSFEGYENLTIYPLKTKELEGAVIQLDDVTDKIQMEEMLIQSEKMLSLGGVAAGIAHEINSPLSGIACSANNLKRRLFEDLQANVKMADECSTLLEKIQCYMDRRGISNMLDSITEASTRTSRMVRNILNFSRKSARKMEFVSLIELLNSTYELAAGSYEVSKLGLGKIEIEREYSNDMPWLNCDASMIQQVIFNVFRNGLEAMAEKKYENDHPRFIVKIYSENDCAVIEIEDNGPGMPEEIKSQIFNAFFTTKRVGSGTGLGLSISYFIITELHNGSIEVFSSPGDFTKFVIKLPFSGIKSSAKGQSETGKALT
jgi:PAS domain S-box-containing protein